LKFKSISRKKDSGSEIKESTLGHGGNGFDEKPSDLEANLQTKVLAPKIDLAKVEGPRFEPHFDPYLDGDNGDLDEAIKYLVSKSLSTSYEPLTSAETIEDGKAEQDESAQHDSVEVMPKDTKTKAKEEGLSDVDLLRVRLWRARASHSRQAGLALVILSAALFAAAFLTSALIFEVGSVSSFVVGLSLLAYEAEPRVKLFPSMSSLIGPLMAVKDDLRRHNVAKAKAVFERSPSPQSGRDLMSFVAGTNEEDEHRYSIPPLGEGLVHAYELELGDLTKLNVDEAKVWLPRVMVDGLGLADRVAMKSSGNEVTTVMEKPFVRILCVQDFMVDGLCQVSGCPLAASVGQALARASGKPVTHNGCTYDPVTQKATLKDFIEQ
jgi:hypothetical protein